MANKSRKIYIYLPLLFSIVLIIGILLGMKLVSFSNADNNFFSINLKKYNKINDVIYYIENSYVDSVDKEEMMEKGIIGMLENLDPHSQYISVEDFNEINDPLEGNFQGIGVQFRMLRDTITVINTIPGGPSEGAGILAGDRIVKIEGDLVAGVNFPEDDVKKRLKGTKGTEVKISVYRWGEKGLLDFTLTRGIIPTYSVDISYMVKDSIGYIKVSTFSGTSYSEFVEALEKLSDEGMQKLILDLRGNSGGLLSEAISMADELLKKGELIVYTEGINRSSDYAFATKKGLFNEKPLIVLIDESSASASEIIAGAIQDNDRGTIVGRRSYGKGLVQEQLGLIDGSAIRLTVSRYHTPTGRCIQKSYNNGIEDYYREFHRRYDNGELENADSIRFIDSLKYTTPKGKIVYGGGGIMPDVYIAVKSGEMYRYFNLLVNKNLIYLFSFDYTDKHRKKLNQFKSAKDLDQNFTITAKMFDDFVKFAEDNGVQRDEEGIKFSQNRIKNLIKSLIARNIFDDEGFYPIYLRSDSTFIKAVEMLSDENYVF
ncbi:MAG: S41 family peptidase [Bacteroidales bacterium]|nr:S41 family peptidase [Bacteroidales bacterium]